MNISGSGKKRRAVRKAPSLYYSSSIGSARVNRKTNLRFVWPVMKITLPVVLLVYFFFYSPIFRINEVIISGNEYIDSQFIAENIPRNANIFTLKNEQLESEIMEDIKDLETVKIYKGIPRAIKIVVKEHAGVMNWQSGISNYLISSSGIAFRDITTDVASYGALPKVVDQRNVPVEMSKRVVSAHFANFINKIFSDLKVETNIDPDFFSIDETTVDVIMHSKNGFYIKFDSMRSAEKQMHDLKLVLMEKRPEITEYVDLRVNGWAYYK